MCVPMLVTTHVETVVLLSQQKPDDRIEVEIELDALEHFGMVQIARWLHDTKLYTLYHYDGSRRSVVMTDMDGKELVIDCDKAEEQETVQWNFYQDFFAIQNITYIQSSNLLKSTLVNFAKKVLYGDMIYNISRVQKKKDNAIGN